ncbi:hypothetical protein N2152v2_005037 [Parachlorella kessleri]
MKSYGGPRAGTVAEGAIELSLECRYRNMVIGIDPAVQGLQSGPQIAGRNPELLLDRKESAPEASFGSFAMAQAAAHRLVKPTDLARGAPQPSYGAKSAIIAADGSSSRVHLSPGGGMLPEVASFQHFTTPPTQSLSLAGKQGPQALSELQHQQSFTIPAFKCLTEDDLILTDELEEGGVLAAAFGDLADISKMGLLPSEEDLKLQLFDPTPPPAAPLAPAPHPSLVAPFFDPFLTSLPTPFSMRPGGAPLGLQQQVLHQQLHAALLRQQQLQLQLLQQQGGGLPGTGLWGEQGAGLEVKQEPLEAEPGAPDSHTPPSRSSSLGSIKRRMDAMDLEDPGSARGVKRSNSFNSLLAWEAAGTTNPSAPLGRGPAAAGAGAGAMINAGYVSDMHRTASAPQSLSRFSLGPGGSSASRSVSPSPAPTPVRRAERASPAKTPQRAHSTMAAFELVQATSGSSGSGGGGGNTQAVYKGVSKHKLTQRCKECLWLAGLPMVPDSSDFYPALAFLLPAGSPSGRQLYLGGFDDQDDAARAYDIAALACKGEGADTNFPATDYVVQMQEVQGLTRDEVVAYVRRRSSAFSRGKSRYRGVSGHEGRWEARIGSFQGRKNVSFGIFDLEADAARQYDRALILEKGRSAKTNFPLRDYQREVAEYEAYVLARCGSFDCPEAVDIAQDYTLPTKRTATLEDKKRAAVIYAEDLRCKFWTGF